MSPPVTLSRPFLPTFWHTPFAIEYPIERGCCFEDFFTKVGPIGNINEHRHILLLRLLRIVPDFMFMAHCSPRRCF
jgi:hypothetical protein